MFFLKEGENLMIVLQLAVPKFIMELGQVRVSFKF